METGIVTKSTGVLYTVRTANGQRWECRIRGKLRISGVESTNPVAVGDVVDFAGENSSEGNITDVHPRKNYIVRKSVNLSKRSQIIAANIDRAYLVVTVSNPSVQQGFTDRFLVTAEAYHIPATILFNKTDSCNVKDKKKMAESVSMYRSAGYVVNEISAIQPESISFLRKEIAGKKVLFGGQSGVGKSTLVNAIDPDLNLRTNEVSDYHNKGQHTTTFAEMFELKSGGFVIDTPGIKSFGLYDFDKAELSHCFPEMRGLIHDCKFHNCQHVNEPGCAIIKAYDEGKIHPLRYSSYLNILTDDETETYRKKTKK